MSDGADPPPSRLRWFIAGMLFLAAVLNYVDRTVLSILAPTIQSDLGIDDTGYAWINSAFLIAYTAGYILSGRVLDRFGGVASMAGFLGFWSLANAVTGFVRSPVQLGAARFMLGLGEAGGWTASPKIVGRWFSPGERAFVVGLYTAGGTVGATIAPMLSLWLAASYGWQSAFIATGAAGIAWLIPWLLFAPRDSRGPADANEQATVTWREVLSQRIVWLLLTARLLTDGVWYFIQQWFPKYLHAERGVAQEDLSVMWLLYLAADVGLIGGGLLSGWLVARGTKPASARLVMMVVAAAIVPISARLPSVESAKAALAIGMAMAFGHAIWLTNLTALAIDAIPPRMLATSFGVIAAGSGLGGVAMNILVADAVRRHSYAPCFLAAAVLHPLAILLLRAGLARSRR
jgi:ACS family hexuronate transporter-like MFS transporter